jgi:hypothetical protein
MLFSLKDSYNTVQTVTVRHLLVKTLVTIVFVQQMFSAFTEEQHLEPFQEFK